MALALVLSASAETPPRGSNAKRVLQYGPPTGTVDGKAIQAQHVPEVEDYDGCLTELLHLMVSPLVNRWKSSGTYF